MQSRVNVLQLIYNLKFVLAEDATKSLQNSMTIKTNRHCCLTQRIVTAPLETFSCVTREQPMSGSLAECILRTESRGTWRTSEIQ